MKYIYGVLCALGALLPLGIIAPWFLQNGGDIGLFVAEAVSTRTGAFAWGDVLVSAIVLIVFILRESAHLGMKRVWLPILGTCTVGVSLGLPLFLLLRELHIECRER